MPLSDIDKKEIKRGEQKLKSIIGGTFSHNHDFLELIKANNIKEVHDCWNKINKQVKLELKDSSLTYDEIEERVYQLLLMESPNSRLITLKEAEEIEIERTKRDIFSRGRLYIEIPYTSSGVGDIVMGGAVLGKTGAMIGALSEGQTKWKSTELLILDEGVNVKSTGQVLLYNDIKNVVLGEKSIRHTIVTIITDNGNSLIFKANNNEAPAVKRLIDNRIPASTPDHKSRETDENIEILLKYADLYERGLLTREEFDLKKEELLYSSHIETEHPQEKQQLYCWKCGSKIEDDSNFCTNCGDKLNFDEF